MSQVAASPATVLIAAYVRETGSTTVAGVAHALTLSRTSAESALGVLADAGLVRIAGPAETCRRAGRPARRYHFCADSAVVIGVDIGVATIQVIAANVSGTICAQRSFAGVGNAVGGAAKLAVVVEAIRHLLDDPALPSSHLAAIGVALPGIVDQDGKVVDSVVIPEWSGVDIGERLRNTFRCPVAVDNGVRLAAVAEHHLGSAQLIDDLLYVSVGRRIAASMILGGTPRRGAQHVAGDIGRVAFPGVTDQTGQIEWHCAPTAADVFARARDGDPAACAEVATFVTALSHGIAILVMTVDPALIVIGGGLSAAHGELLEPLRKELRRQLRPLFTTPVVEARLGAAAAVHGALVHAFSCHSEEIYGLALPTPVVTALVGQEGIKDMEGGKK